MAISELKVSIHRRAWIIHPVFMAAKLAVFMGANEDRAVELAVKIIAKYGYRYKI